MRRSRHELVGVRMDHPALTQADMRGVLMRLQLNTRAATWDGNFNHLSGPSVLLATTIAHASFRFPVVDENVDRVMGSLFAFA